MKQMGFMDKLLDVMRLNEDDYEFDNDDYEFEDDYEEEEVKEKKPSRKERKEEQQAKRSETNFDMSGRRQKNVNKITPITKNKKQGQQGMEVCVIKPNAIEDELEITETLLRNRTVVLNLEGIDLEIGQRIIDFTSGATYAMHGNLQKISNYIFLATPNGVDISGDIQNLMDSMSKGFTV